MKYWLIFFIICFCLFKSHSQTNYILAGDTDTNKVFYYDIVDLHPYWQEEYFDMNNDGIDDFKFAAGENHYMNYWVASSGINSLNENLVFVDDQQNPKILNPGDTIGKNSNWSRNNTSFYSHCEAYFPEYSSVYSGIWNNVNDKHVGTLLVCGTDSLLGWFLISVNSSHISIKSFAIQKYNIEQPDTTETPDSIINNLHLIIFPDMATHRVIVKAPEIFKKNYSFNIYNIHGVKLFQSDLFRNEMVWDVPHSLSGIFIVNVFLEEKCVMRKKIAFY